MTLSDWGMDPSVLFRVFLAILLGGAVGLEREIHGRMAGLRTHVMVCLGATILILASEFSLGRVDSPMVTFNPDRVAAGIITGIGFLGAGAIMKEESLVRGLTTAGCIWFIAGLGIVIGKKFYGLAVCATVAALAILVLFRYVEGWVPILQYRDLMIRVQLEKYDHVRTRCLGILKENDMLVEDRKLTVENHLNELEFKYRIRMRKGCDLEGLIHRISQVPGVIRVGW